MAWRGQTGAIMEARDSPRTRRDIRRPSTPSSSPSIRKRRNDRGEPGGCGDERAAARGAVGDNRTVRNLAQALLDLPDVDVPGALYMAAGEFILVADVEQVGWRAGLQTTAKLVDIQAGDGATGLAATDQASKPLVRKPAILS